MYARQTSKTFPDLITNCLQKQYCQEIRKLFISTDQAFGKLLWHSQSSLLWPIIGAPSASFQEEQTEEEYKNAIHSFVRKTSGISQNNNSN